NPVIDARLTQAKQLGHDRLQGVGLEIHQKEQQLLLGRAQHAGTATAGEALSRLASQGSIGWIAALIRPGESCQERLKLRPRQAGERQELPRVVLEFHVRKHTAILLLFLIKSIAQTPPSTGRVWPVT